MLIPLSILTPKCITKISKKIVLIKLTEYVPNNWRKIKKK